MSYKDEENTLDNITQDEKIEFFCFEDIEKRLKKI